MQTEAAQIPDKSISTLRGKMQSDIDDEVIHLDEDLFPWNGDDDLEAYVDACNDRHDIALISEHATEPPWRRIERYKDQQRLYRQLEEIR